MLLVIDIIGTTIKWTSRIHRDRRFVIGTWIKLIVEILAVTWSLYADSLIMQ